MQKTVLLSLRRLALLLPLSLMLFMTGCVPLGMVWMPDSSGFIYPAGKQAEQIMFYDAAKRAHRVLIENTGATTLIPALSPDGKRIAVARIRRVEGHGESAQVVIYDKDGKEAHQSPILPWKETAEQDEGKYGTIVFWDRAGKRVLFCAPLQKEPQTGIYDPESKKLQTVAGLLLPFGGSPIGPGGKGYLVIAGAEKPEVTLVDWDGKKQKIELDPETLTDNDRRTILTFPWWFSSRWDGDAALVSYDEWRIRLDTKKLAGSLEKRPAAEARVGGDIIQQTYEFAGGVKVRALVTKGTDGKQDKSRLEILTPGAAKPRVIIGDAKGLFGFSPSPDKKLLAVWCVDDGSGKPYVYVLNNAGELVSDSVVHDQ
jgi:hypothetical protein